MKGISHLATVLLVALTGTWVSAEAENQTEVPIPTECPANNVGNAVHIAHESDCGSFYKCDHGEKVLHTCPSGLAFNPALQVCDWPEEVGCTPGNSDDTDGSDSGISSSSSPSEVESTSESGNENIVASSTTEAASVSSEGSGSDVTEAVEIPTECPAENRDHAVHIAHESDCGLFYQCNHGEKVLRQCTSGLAFNPALQVCDWPENVGCTPGNSDDTDGSDSGISSSSSPSEVESTSESGNENIVASSTTEAASVSSEGPGSDVTEAVEIPTECPAENGDHAVHIAHESDCGSFYQCNHGEKVLMQCASGLAFNPALQVCDWAENVGCTPDSSDDTDGNEVASSTESSNDVIESSSSSPEVELPNNESSSSSPDANNSAENDSDSSEDSDADDSDSSDSDNDDSNDENSTAASNDSEEAGSGEEDAGSKLPTECPATNEGDAVLIAHESDCGSFYKCNHGEKVEFKCPSGLNFNAALKVCDWPKDAGCTASGSDESGNSDSGDSENSNSNEVESSTESNSNASDEIDSAEDVSGNSEESNSDDTESEAVIPPTECPADNEGDAVHIAHESDCGSFYKCDHGKKVEQQCPANLHFNAVSQVCDWPESAGCIKSN